MTGVRRVDPLDRKQREVLERAAEGASGAETGRAMGYSVDGIKSIRRDVLRLLGARNMTHAVALDRAARHTDRTVDRGVRHDHT